jgi:hypothetical protein
MEAWQQRIIDEYDQLKERTNKLEAFRADELWDELDLVDQTLMESQYLFMVGYGNILEKRIERFEEK